MGLKSQEREKIPNKGAHTISFNFKKIIMGCCPILCGSKLNKEHMILMKYPKDPRDQAEDGAGKNVDPMLSASISTPSHQPCSP